MIFYRVRKQRREIGTLIIHRRHIILDRNIKTYTMCLL